MLSKEYRVQCFVRIECGAVTKMCVVFFCVQIIYISLYFSASESAPERHVAKPSQ